MFAVLLFIFDSLSIFSYQSPVEMTLNLLVYQMLLRNIAFALFDHRYREQHLNCNHRYCFEVKSVVIHMEKMYTAALRQPVRSQRSLIIIK